MRITIITLSSDGARKAVSRHNHLPDVPAAKLSVEAFYVC